MTEEEKTLFAHLCWKPATEKNFPWESSLREFLSRFRPHQSSSQRVRDVLIEAIQSHDAEEVGILDGIICGLGYSEEHLPLLATLFRQEWHYNHENMVQLLEDFQSDEAIEALAWAAQVRLKYLEYNNSEALARKAIYALARMPGQQARETLQRIADTSHGQRREWAKRKMKEQSQL